MGRTKLKAESIQDEDFGAFVSDEGKDNNMHFYLSFVFTFFIFCNLSSFFRFWFLDDWRKFLDLPTEMKHRSLSTWKFSQSITLLKHRNFFDRWRQWSTDYVPFCSVLCSRSFFIEFVNHEYRMILTSLFSNLI